MGVPEVAERYGLSAWTIRNRARLKELPHRKPPGARDLLFDPDELDRFDEGSVHLEYLRLPRGGRVVRVTEA
jgi:Helix-turn-helix domain